MTFIVIAATLFCVGFVTKVWDAVGPRLDIQWFPKPAFRVLAGGDTGVMRRRVLVGARVVSGAIGVCIVVGGIGGTATGEMTRGALVACLVLGIVGLVDGVSFIYRCKMVRGVAIAGLSVVVAAGSVDSLWFLRGDVGIVDAVAIGASDVSCSGEVLYRREEKTVRYRCPTGSLLGAVEDGGPLLVWPDYVEGTSVELKVAIDSAIERARKVVPEL